MNNTAAFTVGIDRLSDTEVKIAIEMVEATVHDVLLVLYDSKREAVKVGGARIRGGKCRI